MQPHPAYTEQQPTYRAAVEPSPSGEL